MYCNVGERRRRKRSEAAAGISLLCMQLCGCKGSGEPIRFVHMTGKSTDDDDDG